MNDETTQEHTLVRPKKVVTNIPGISSTIRKELSHIEHVNNIRMLFAVESEFLNKGYSSDCEHEIVFVYSNLVNNISTVTCKDTTNYLSQDKERYYQGCEIKDFINRIASTDIWAYDVITADIIYYSHKGLLDKILVRHNSCYNTKFALSEFTKQAYGFYKDWLEDSHFYNKAPEKYPLNIFKFLLRPILACKYIELYGTHPAISLSDLIDKTVDEPRIKKRLHRFLTLIDKPSRREHPIFVEDLLQDYAINALMNLYAKYGSKV